MTLLSILLATLAVGIGSVWLAAALMRMGRRTGVIDLDIRQRSLTRYIENRARWIAALRMPSATGFEGEFAAIDVDEIRERRIVAAALHLAVLIQVEAVKQ